jgi:hypothetical protein
MDYVKLGNSDLRVSRVRVTKVESPIVGATKLHHIAKLSECET